MQGPNGHDDIFRQVSFSQGEASVLAGCCNMKGPQLAPAGLCCDSQSRFCASEGVPIDATSTATLILSAFRLPHERAAIPA